MKKLTLLSVGLCFFFSVPASRRRRRNGRGRPPPKVLVIQREYLKPGGPAACTRRPKAPSFVQ